MIAVLLATYQGAAWLREFLQSLRAQSLPEWLLLARDDGSRDGTREILLDAARRDERIQVVDDQLGQRGVAGNFALLMERARSLPVAHLAFADQDDVWLPDKLRVQQSALRELELTFGSQTPLLVHTDLSVVDVHLQTLHASHTRSARVQRDCPVQRLLRTVLAHNVATGCAMLYNRALLELALPLPPQAVLHDWWLTLCAAAAGRVRYLPQPTVLYRQHGANTVGGRTRWLEVLGRRRRSALRRNLRGGMQQAAALLERLNERNLSLNDADRDLLARFAGLSAPNSTAWRRFWEAWRLRTGRPQLAARIGQALLAAWGDC